MTYNLYNKHSWVIAKWSADNPEFTVGNILKTTIEAARYILSISYWGEDFKKCPEVTRHQSMLI